MPNEYDEYSEYMWNCYEQDLKENSGEDDCGMTLQYLEEDIEYGTVAQRQRFYFFLFLPLYVEVCA